MIRRAGSRARCDPGTAVGGSDDGSGAGRDYGRVARAWRDAGITRVSLGVQSFVEAELRMTGRRHTAEVVERRSQCCVRRGSARSTWT